MPANAYHFVSHWRVQAPIEEVFEIISNPRDLVRWWPSVYVDVLEIESGDEVGVGKVVRVETKGWFPYLLHWHFNVTRSERPRVLALRTWGDFAGTGAWTFEQDGAWANVTYDWQVSAEKPFLKYLSPLLRPVFEANHRWAMARGEESLRLEIDRRHTRDEDLHLLPPPPAPTKLPGKTLWFGAGMLAAGILVRWLSRKKHTATQI